ncbi:MAG: DUF1223 domain-containing protein [Polyangiaceae bacterium]
MLTNRELLRGLAWAGLCFCGCSRELPAERALGMTPDVPRSVAFVAASSEAPAVSPKVTATIRGSGVAVVELFTSEGCSSCPPADRVLATLAARAKAASLPVFPLSFHVDYWNYLGWRDRFSSASYSERQREYGPISAGGGTYTPQAVVNGEAECVGSDASRVDALIASALKRPSRTQIALEARRGEHGIEVSYRVSGETTARVINLALVEPRVETAVERGENGGERLVHVNVVRVFSSRPLSEGTAGSWSPPASPSADFQARRVGVVSYVEGVTQRDVSGAAALEL